MQVLKIAGAVLLLSAPLYAQDETARKQAAELMAIASCETPAASTSG